VKKRPLVFIEYKLYKIYLRRVLNIGTFGYYKVNLIENSTFGFDFKYNNGSY